MKSTEVCVDASLAIKVVVPEAGSDKADALFDQWAGEEIQLIAPVFFEVETDSILRQKVSLRRELTADQAQRAFASLRALPIKTTAFSGAKRTGLGNRSRVSIPYRLRRHVSRAGGIGQCEFWTADEKLFKQVRDRLTFVQWLGDYSPVS